MLAIHMNQYGRGRAGNDPADLTVQKNLVLGVSFKPIYQKSMPVFQLRRMLCKRRTRNLSNEAACSYLVALRSPEVKEVVPPSGLFTVQPKNKPT